MFNKILLTSWLIFTSCLSLSSAYANPTITVDDLNHMSQADFERTLDHIFEKAPWAIQQAVAKRPYKGFVDLYEGIITTVKNADIKTQLALIQSYPDLACKGIRATEVNKYSQNEQGSSGLNQCTPQEAAQLLSLSKAYREKFGIPFMLAVKGYSKEDIIEQLQKRLNNDQQQEINTALQQVYKVVLLRLLDTVK